MKPSQLIAFALLAAGARASLRTLTKRACWEATNRNVQIVADYDDVNAASIRAGLPLCELLLRLREHGATHVSLPELSIARLIKSGRLVPTLPGSPITTAPPLGQWIYLASADGDLLNYVLDELNARLPQIQAQRLNDGAPTIAYAGDLETIGEVGLGFEANAARQIHDAGLGVVPRPISYAWADQSLIDRTLDHAARVGEGVIAFDGDLILGHEMHLRATVDALARNHLTFAYFAESRHQRGDWFIAKTRMPAVVLAYRLTPAQMIPEDFHSAAHRWALLVRERGIRLLYINFFRVVHATDPLECLHYIEHIVEEVEEHGFKIAREVPRIKTATVAKNDVVTAGLIAAGTTALALNETFNVPEPIASGLALAGAAAPFALARLDRPRDALERAYAPSYAPKLLALTTAITAPIAATKLARDGTGGMFAAALVDATAASALSALTSGADYQMRVEEYRGYDLDMWLPLLAAATFEITDRRVRAGAIAAGFFGWWLTRQRARDLLGQFDLDHAEGHTHHLSASGRLIGDAMLRLGPRPARKWAWLAPVGAVAASVLKTRRNKNGAVVATIASVLARELALTGFRKPERGIELTARTTLPNYAMGLVAALAILLVGQTTSD